MDIDTAHILALRPSRNRVDPWKPHGSFIERECAASGSVDDVATILLTNSECPFKCLFCDLWKNTTIDATPRGAIPAQIEFALAQLAARHPDRAPRHIKLYNSGNFFDRRAIPVEDHDAIAGRVRGFETVIVENHPRLCGDECVRFRDRIAPAQLEVAVGLETANPDVLRRLNKGMTVEDVAAAAEFLHTNGIATRAFVLLRPPFLDETAGVAWALRSIDFAFNAGMRCCSVIPTRSGNGVMDRLERDGVFEKPQLMSLETVVETALDWKQGRVFADLWNAAEFGRCADCTPRRVARLEQMNLTQRPIPPVVCDVCRH